MNDYQNEEPPRRRFPWYLNLGLSALLAVSSVYANQLVKTTPNIDSQKVAEKNVSMSQSPDITKMVSYEPVSFTKNEDSDLDKIVKNDSTEPVHVNPYNSTSVERAMDAIDYSSIENLDPGLKEQAKSKLREMLSSEWCIKNYPKIFTKLSKFDEMLEDDDQYAFLTQEIGPYILDKKKIPKSKAGATGWGQMMEIAKKENGIEHNDTVDYSYHLMEGIEGLVNHYERYNPDNLENLNSRFMLGMAIYNAGYGSVMKGLAKVIKEDGGDPSDYFVFSDGKVNAIKNPQALDEYDFDWNDMQTALYEETKNYLTNAAVYKTLRDNILKGKFANMKIEQQPSVNEIFAERKLGEYGNVFQAWKEEGKNNNIDWTTYKDVVHMHIDDFELSSPETRILVPVKQVPNNYF